MAFFHFRNVKVAGFSAGVPKRVVNNLTCERRISPHYENADFVATTGVIERRFDLGLTTSDLCFKAAKQLLADLNWDAKDIDAIIFVSQSLDFIFPATSCILQDRLGASKECYTEDVQLGCSGWVYGISNVSSLMQKGDIKRALLCAGDARTAYDVVDRDDTLFGYAGTVTALEYAEGSQGVYGHFGTDGAGYEAIIKPVGGARNPITPEAFDEIEAEDGKFYTGFTTRMKGMDVFSFGISTAPKSVKRLAEKFGFDYLNSDYFIFHQANMKMNDMIVKKLKLPKEKVAMCMPHFGNTSSASIPLTIVTELKGNTTGSKTFICCGFGVGLSWGTIRFTTDNLMISSLVEVENNEHMI